MKLFTVMPIYYNLYFNCASKVQGIDWGNDTNIKEMLESLVATSPYVLHKIAYLFIHYNNGSIISMTYQLIWLKGVIHFLLTQMRSIIREDRSW